MSLVTNESVLTQLVQLREELAAVQQTMVGLERRVRALEDNKRLGADRGVIHKDLARLRHKVRSLEKSILAD